MGKIARIQEIIGALPDDEWGPKSQAALEATIQFYGLHRVLASSFADPADIKRFKKCIAQGKSEKECFKVGDNGIGLWGDDTTKNIPMCALPREDWAHLGSNARGALVLVQSNGREVVCELRDTMPAKRFITNGAGIDLNPQACKALGLEPPIKVKAAWRFLDRSGQ